MTDANETGRFLSLLPDGLRTYIIPIVKDGKMPDVKGNIKARIEEVRLPKHRTIERVKQGGNVAAYAMKDGLVFIDIDTENGDIKLPREKVDELIEKLDTFTVMTRNGGFQLYGINRGFENSLIYYNDINIGEIRADWQYVLLPGSYVPPDEDATESATGFYEIVREQEIKPVSPQDLPEWLEVRRKEIREEKLIKPAQPSQTWINEIGMSLDEIRKKDQKLDELLRGPYEWGYPSRSEADMACATKLWFWRFDESQIAGILQDYRAYEKTQRGDYLSRTVSKAIGGERYVGKAKKNEVKNVNEQENNKNEQIVLVKSFTPRPFVERIIRDYNGNIFYDSSQTLWGYDPETGTWKDVELEIISNLRKNVLGIDQLRTHYVNEILNDLKGITYTEERPKEPHWRYINLKNGVFDILEKKIIDHSPDFFFLNHIPCELDDSIKECPEIDKLFTQWVGEEEKNILYELAGYCLIRGYQYQKMFFLEGNGKNGKSKYMDLLTRFVDEKNTVSVSLSELSGRSRHRFAPARLYGKLVNNAGEISYDDLKDVNILKKSTGGDEITAEEKFKKEFNFKNYAKMIFLTNELPETPDKTDAFYRRYYPITFPFVFNNDEANPLIIEKLSDREFQGLLYKCLYEVIPKFIERGFRFTVDPDTDKLRDMFEERSSPILQFIRTKCMEGPGLKVPKWVFKHMLNEWLRERGKGEWPDERITRWMRSRGFEEGKLNYSEDKTIEYYEMLGWNIDDDEIGNKRWYSWKGLTFKEQTNTTERGHVTHNGWF